MRRKNVLTFIGSICARLSDDEEAKRLRHWLLKGFQYLPAVGALKGIGFGRIVNANVSEPERLPEPTRRKPFTFSAHPQQNRFAVGLRLTLDRPFCFARMQVKDNRFISEDFIPGGAIIGAIASRLRQQLDIPDETQELSSESSRWPKLCQYLNKLRITHALPVLRGRGQRPIAVPCSLVFAPASDPPEQRRDDLFDMAFESNPRTINGEAPVFCPDWKASQWRRALSYCGWEEPPRRGLIVRNQIDHKTGTVRFDAESQNGMLYSYETVVPDKHHWHANLHLPAMPKNEAQILISELQELMAPGLAGLGKTKATAKVDIIEQPWPFACTGRPSLPDSGAPGASTRDPMPVVLVLQTPALLLPPDFRSLATNEGDKLKIAYGDTWAQLSEGSLRLRHFFAREALAGGKYWWNRYAVNKGARKELKNKKEQHAYRPVLLTEASSVFVFAIKDTQKAIECLETWRHEGLPQLKGNPYGAGWRDNPCLAQNGYGEIAVNLELHWSRAAPKAPGGSPD